MAEPSYVLTDIEVYRNFFFAACKRVSDGMLRTFEHSSRKTFNTARLRSIMEQCCTVTFNGDTYDTPLIAYAMKCIEEDPASANDKIKRASDRIINGNVKYWHVEEMLDIKIPRSWDRIDLIEPQPGVMIGLKTLIGRLHGKRLQDLPIEPDTVLTHEQMDALIDYCVNSDIPGTELALEAMKEPLALRVALGAEYKMDFRSKSDAQIGESIIKKRVEQVTKQKIERVVTPPGYSFGYKVPNFVSFERADLRDMVERLRNTEFYVNDSNKTDLPKWLEGLKFTIGESVYAMGIGGLHSTEENRAVHSTDTHVLIDADVASQYPSIIMKLGLYPRAIGKTFLDVYGKIKADRLVAKREKNKVKDQGLKIALNGVYGKLGSPYSVLYAPHLMIAVTLTGQLSLLMLIERAEAAGIPVVSANTDGVVFHCPRDREEELYEITKAWEAQTGFELEFAKYRSIYNQSVNSYIAIKEDGKDKRKGPVGNPWADGDLRSQMMKNPQMTILSDAVTAYLKDGTPLEDTIRACNDIRSFVTVVKVTGGATWRGEYLGKVVRYIWSTDGEEILYKKPHPTTGNFKKVSKTDGCRPVMTLPDELPIDIDYDRYIAEAREILMDLGDIKRPDPIKPLRFYKKYHPLYYFVIAV